MTKVVNNDKRIWRDSDCLRTVISTHFCRKRGIENEKPIRIRILRSLCASVSAVV